MKGRSLTAAEIAEFTEHLVLEERSAATVENMFGMSAPLRHTHRMEKLQRKP